jgi:hypothetical protein
MKASVAARRAPQSPRAPADSGWAAQSKVRTLATLMELGEASPVGEDEFRGLLEEVADSSPASAPGAQPRLADIEVLEQLDAPLFGSAPTPSSPPLLYQCGRKELVLTARSQFVRGDSLAGPGGDSCFSAGSGAALDRAPADAWLSSWLLQ